MQEIWAKILVGEIRQPKSISKRTLEILRNLSKDEALLFEKICKKCIMLGQNLSLVRYDDFLEQNNIRFREILYLSEIGLIESSRELSLKLQLEKYRNNMLLKNNNLILTSLMEDEEKKIEIPIYPLTTAGKQLANILKLIIDDDSSFIEVAKEIQKNNETINIGVYKIINFDGVKFEITLENLLK